MALLATAVVVTLGCSSFSSDEEVPSLAEVSPSPVYPSNTLTPGPAYPASCPVMTVDEVEDAVDDDVVATEEQTHAGFRGCIYHTSSDEWVRVYVAGPVPETTVEQAITRPFNLGFVDYVTEEPDDLHAYYGVVESLDGVGDAAYYGHGGVAPQLLVAGQLEGSAVRVVRLEASDGMTREALVSLVLAVLERV